MSQAERALERGTHYIEESIWVYLMRDWDGTDRWVLDPVTVDGCGLDSGLEDGARNSECMCDNQAECSAIRDRMDKVYLPTAEELLHLLAESLGYTVSNAVQP
ncbi:hypothetical protein HYG77_36645 (plasmid) [Rhodococcus sp. ZPP]|uniref:hypothetical protein n=1 Tax=Rhodococcus TaxID=1827 RepID=UPI001AD8924E|nr:MULTISPECIES: hypothetical protein [Rhodococcus]MBO8150837.1 hypothetical protein [Rhodococcus erythropolis]QTJ71001.1 hypothetical protein HYG77_36645 [Rhodococcus sp. ZPP]